MVGHRWSGPEVLEVKDLPEPPFRLRRVRIAFRAAGIAFQDTRLIGGKYQTKPPFPICPTTKAAALLPRLAKATRISDLAKWSSRCVRGAGGGVGLAAVHSPQLRGRP